MAPNDGQKSPMQIPVHVRGAYVPSNRTPERPPQLNLEVLVSGRYCTCGCSCTNCRCPAAGFNAQPWDPLQANSSGGGNTATPFPPALNPDLGSGVASVSAIPDLTSGGVTYESEDELSINMDPDERGVKLSEGENMHHGGQDFQLYDDYATDVSDEATGYSHPRENSNRYRNHAPRDRQAINANPWPHFLDPSASEIEEDDEPHHTDLTIAESTVLSKGATPEGPFHMEDDLDVSMSSSIFAQVGSSSFMSSDGGVSPFVSSIISSIYSPGLSPGILHGIGDRFGDGSNPPPFIMGSRPVEQRGPWLRLLG